MTGVRFSSLVPGNAIVIKANPGPALDLVQEKSQVYFIDNTTMTVPRLMHLGDTTLLCTVVARLEHVGFQSTYDNGHTIWCVGPWIVAMVMNRSTPLGLVPVDDRLRNGSMVMLREDDDVASLFAVVQSVL